MTAGYKCFFFVCGGGTDYFLSIQTSTFQISKIERFSDRTFFMLQQNTETFRSTAAPGFVENESLWMFFVCSIKARALLYIKSE